VKWLYPSYKVLRDLSPGSDIIQEVTTSKIRCPFLSIVSVEGNLPVMMENNDGIVTVSSQKAAKAHKTIEIPSNHFEVVQDKATVIEIQKFLF
jgi:archaeosine-15-forming tRNA-guanine transglycosylase